MRQSVLFFGLVAVLLCAAGLILRLVARAAVREPASAVAVVAILVVAAAMLKSASSRRTAIGRKRPPEVPVPVIAVPASGVEADDYAAMDPDAFEQAVAALCERDGCRDVQVVGGAGDLGADVIATAPDGRRVVIQCKRYGPVNRVGSQEVQRFGGTCYAVHEASVAAVVTTGEFTQPAAEYAEQCGIHCFDHDDLAAWTDGTGPPPWDAAD
nr:restriction endonuclease [Streptomyces sp. ISL-36]